MKPEIRMSSALKALGRVGEAMEGYKRILRLDSACSEAKDGLRECQQQIGEST